LQKRDLQFEQKNSSELITRGGLSGMALKDTCKTLKGLLETLQSDLGKAEAGNKAAAQRVRTSSIKFEKIAKLFRKESVKADKNGAMDKAKAASKKGAAAPKKAQPAAKQPASKPSSAPKKREPTKKVATARKKPTAKLPKAVRRKK
jgi:hypothetical protein